MFRRKIILLFTEMIDYFIAALQREALFMKRISYALRYTRYEIRNTLHGVWVRSRKRHSSIFLSSISIG